MRRAENLENLIIISGKKRSGKDTCANIIKDLILKNSSINNPSVDTFALADKMKRICIAAFDLPEEKCFGPSKGRDFITDIPRHLFEKVDSTGNNSPFLTIREILQIVGSDIFRESSPNIWCYLVARDIINSEVEHAIITDCRFPNELTVTSRLIGIEPLSLRIRSKRTPEDGHISENSFEEEDAKHDRGEPCAFDYVIWNDNSIEELRYNLYSVLIQESIL